MDENRIEEIVRKIFDKATTKSVSHKKSALSNEIAHIISEKYKYIHPKTLERAYDRYIDKNGKHGAPNAESVNLFCNYLEYEDYGAYVESNPVGAIVKPPPKGEGVKWKLIITISIAFGMTILILGIQNWPFNILKNNPNGGECMTWADSLYVTVSCDKGPFSQHGTKVEPLIETKLRNMRKVEVNAAYKFFSKADEPLIWYYKKSNREIEYFTAPGLHPTNGETLRKITPYIIQTYVPKHMNRKSSFVPK